MSTLGKVGGMLIYLRLPTCILHGLGFPTAAVPALYPGFLLHFITVLLCDQAKAIHCC